MEPSTSGLLESLQRGGGGWKRGAGLAVLAAAALVLAFTVIRGLGLGDSPTVGTTVAAAPETEVAPADPAPTEAAADLERAEETDELAEPADAAAAMDQGMADETADEIEPEAAAEPERVEETAEPERVEAFANAPQLAGPPPRLGEVGTLTNLDGWLQSDFTSLEELEGQAYVVQFWTFGCFNCKNTLENLRRVYDIYGEDGPDGNGGIEVVGVHAPEFSWEADPTAIAEAAVELRVNWPIALDTEKTNFRTWQGSRRFWPRTYVVDQNGQIRFDRIGEGAYEQLEATVAWLLEHGPDEAAAT